VGAVCGAQSARGRAPPGGLTTTLDQTEYHPLPPPAADPVEQAELALRQAELHLSDARDALLHAKTVLAATLNLPVQGILHGSLHQQDDFAAQALEEVDEQKRLYDEAWAARAHARDTLAQLTRTHREGHQKAWVKAHRPALVQAVAQWQEAVRTATSDREHAHAKKEYQSAFFAYHQAVAQAPWRANGTPTGETV
jgi:hypothetical protein